MKQADLIFLGQKKRPKTASRRATQTNFFFGRRFSELWDDSPMFNGVQIKLHPI